MNPQDTQPQPVPQQPQPTPPPPPPTPQPQQQPQSQPQPQPFAQQPIPPQPVPAYPQQPLQPGMPMPPPPSNTPSAKPKKGLLLALAGGVAGLAIVLAIVFLVVLGGGVSKEDYRELGDELNTTSGAYNKISTVYLSTYSTEDEIKNGLDTTKKARSNFEAQLKEVGELKAVKKDKELKKLYEAVLVKKVKFDKAMDATIEAYEEILPAVGSTSELSTSSSANVVSGITTLRQEFEDIGTLKDANNKEFVDEMISLLTKLETLAVKVQQGQADYRKYDSQATGDFYDTLTDISDAARDWESNLQKLADDGELKDDLNSLQSAAQKKIV